MGGDEDAGKASNVGRFIAPISSQRPSRATIRAVETGTEIMTDLDNHADTCVVSPNTALITTDYETPVRISGYADNVGRTTCRTVTGVIAYEDHQGTTWYLHLHQALEIPGVTHNLLSPMQLRERGLRVNDEPKHLVPNPTEYHHAIAIQRDDEHAELIIPLMLRGVTHCFPTRKPTQQEYDTSDPGYHIDMTHQDVEWDPQTTDYGKSEESMLDVYGRIRKRPKKPDFDRIIAAVARQERDTVPEDDLGLALVANRNVSAIKTQDKRKGVDAPTLSQRWGISIEAAKRTIQSTTQNAIRYFSGERLSRRFRTNDRKLRYRRLSATVFSDTLKAVRKSWFRVNRYAQVFCTNFGWTRAYPMRSKSDAHKGMTQMFQDVGVPHTIVVDNAKEQILGDFKSKASAHGARIKSTEPYSPWQQAAEGVIKEIKRSSLRKQVKMKSPYALWDHSIELEALIRSHTAHGYEELDGQVPETIMTGQTADISPYVEHEWYEWVKAIDPTVSYPNDKEILGRWLGPARDVGPAMCSKILKSNGQILYTSSYRALTTDEWRNPEEAKARQLYDTVIGQKLGEPTTESKIKSIDPDAITPTYDYVEPESSTPDIDDATPEYHDQYIGAEVALPFQGTITTGKVKRRTRTETGDLFGKSHENPILDTRSYEVEFPDGNVSSYTANVIAMNMLAQCDEEGNHLATLDGIIGHDTDGTEILHKDRYIVRGNNRHLRKTTRGWKLHVKWKDGSTSKERLADMKESYPVQVAEYATANGIDSMPAFAWWVPYVLKKRDRIIAAVTNRYVKRTHKFGFEIPKTVERAYEIDKENGNTFWTDAIEKEMKNVRVAFNIVNKEDIPKGYQYIDCHMIFDVKMEANFRRKARLVAGGHQTDQPNVPTYASVVSRETVRIALTYAALNDLEVKGSDIRNAFLAAPCEEKVYTILGPEFGPDQGKYALITRALYGLKSAGSSFNRHLADCMHHMGYKPCKADPDLWIKAEKRPDDGVWYYSYVLFYVDDCLAIRHDATEVLKELDKYFPMKEGSIGDPDIYLGAKLRKVRLDNGVTCWALSSAKYVQEAVTTTEKYIREHLGIDKFPKTGSGPWPTNYVSETDESSELETKRASYYQSLVGILHWMVELGRVDIITETSVLASHMAMPREGHLDAALHVFGYLQRKTNARMVFDPTYPDIDQDQFPRHDWERFYGDVKEAIPIDCPKPLGKSVDLRMMVDADWAGDKARRRSRTGFFIFLNSAPIAWRSKRQATVETSVFGAEFVALKQGIEALRGLRYKLRMMGIPISGPSYVYGDNMSVIKNSSKPESTLNKKSNQICYHAVREAVAMGECLITHIPTGDNLGDLATKLIPGGIKRSRLVDMVLYDIESPSTVDT